MTPPSDVFAHYEAGLRALLRRLGKDHARYAEALVYQQRLGENITQSRRYGDTGARRAGRAEVIDRLNALASDALGISFNELCELEASLPEGEALSAGEAPAAATTPAPPVTWMHLSDLHFRPERAYDENVVLQALLGDVAERQERDGLRPNFIVVTGDLAFSGKPPQYDLAGAFFDRLLKVTGLPKSRLFPVPGNHDVDRGRISFGARAMAQALTGRDQVNALLASPEDWRSMMDRFQGYAGFIHDYFAGYLPFDEERYFYVRRVDLGGIGVAILGLNSAWLCGSDEDRKEGLLLGERQVRAALEEAAAADLKIALLHHPFDWLRDFDRDDSEALLLDNCDFVLHGHIHRTTATQLISPDSAAMVLAGGACYETRDYPNMVNWVQLDPAAGRGTVHIRRYSDARGGFWAPDTLSYKNVTDGTYPFALRGGPRVVAVSAPERPPEEAPPPAPIDEKAYLRCLLDRHGYLSLKGMGVFDRVPLRLPLLELYVPLQARVEMPEGETWKRGLHLAGRELAAAAEEAEALIGRLGEPRPVLALLQENDGLIVLGDPGAGKTTFLKFLTLKLAQEEGEELGLGGHLPVLLPLSAYANALAEGDVRLDDFIAGYLHDLGADLPVGEVVGQALREGRALVLLDGLDEVKEVGLRHTVVERVVDFYVFHRRAGNKFVLTSRVVGYREVRPTAEGLAECTLVDFDDDEIEAFVEKWTLALERRAQAAGPLAAQDAARERADLLEAIETNPGVRRLAANPLLLTILALIKRQGVILPDRRVQLYDQCVETMLSSWNRVRSLSGRPGPELDVGQTMLVLAPLALWMHEVNPGVGLVRREELQRRLVAIYRERGLDDPEGAAERFLRDVREHAGLLLERGPGEYGFIHLTFEEYLAGVAIARRGQQGVEQVVDYLAERVGKGAWREVSRLAVGYLGVVQHWDEVAGAVVEGLVARAPGEAGEAAVLAGEAVLDAWPGGVPPRSKERVEVALVGAMQGAEVAPPLRRQAGRIVGRLGWRPADLEAWVEIAPGPFLYRGEKEQREIAYRYWIGKYPVTNAQYACFVDAGGYERRELWSEEGWAWREERGYDRPRYWDDPAWNNPVFPVVGVSWYEAQAYGRWLTERLGAGEGGLALPEGYVARLPTGEEWERAVRGVDGRVYPWGGEFDERWANTWEGGVRSTTAVCTYPQGVGPEGLRDGAGNVWEWCEGSALRGGSWVFSQDDARCSSRLRLNPTYRYYDLGFRVVVSPAL